MMENIKFSELPISKKRESEIKFDEIIPRLSGAKNTCHPTSQVYIELILSLANKIDELEKKITNDKDKFKPSFQKITILKGKQGSGKTTEANKIIGNREFIELHEISGINQKIKKPYTHEYYEIVLFEEILPGEEIKIINHDFPPQVKEIIICITI